MKISTKNETVSIYCSFNVSNYMSNNIRVKKI